MWRDAARTYQRPSMHKKTELQERVNFQLNEEETNKQQKKVINTQERHKLEMERISVTLLMAVALCIVGCFSAPITTPPPPPPPAVPVNEATKESHSSLAGVEDVMMDPAAKLRKFSGTAGVFFFFLQLICMQA